MLKVSVVIPTYNHARFLSQAIDSVCSQTLAPYEVIVIDDGSTDDTQNVLARHAKRIRALRQQNKGVAAARNAGVMIASGDLIAFLDADDLWLPHKLERQVELFASQPGIGLVHCATEDINENGVPLRRHFDGLEGLVATEMLLFRRAVILGGGSGVVIPHAVFQKVGGFDEKLSTSADWDLYYRIASRHKVGFVPEVLLQYRLHATNMHGNVRAMEHDMMLAYEKAFTGADAETARLRRRCYGNLHAVLAGSFFSAGEMSRFFAHAAKSLYLTPGNISRFAQYPSRWRRRAIARRGSASASQPTEMAR
jgi:glycosyltransferase involved in cell wall biosynthesis